MIVKIEDKEYTVVDKFEDVTLGQWLKGKELERKYENDELTESEYNLQYIINILKIEEKELKRIDLPSFYTLRDYIADLFLQDLPEKYESQHIMLNGRRFKFDTNLGTISYFMYDDLFPLLKEDFYKVAALIAASLIRPVDKEDNISEYNVSVVDSNVELMKEHLRMGDFNPISVFFLVFSRELLLTSPQFTK